LLPPAHDLDDEVGHILAGAQAAWILIRSSCKNEPLEWHRRHPDELFLNDDGVVQPTLSLASDLYTEMCGRETKAWIGWCEERPWAHRIIDYPLLHSPTSNPPGAFRHFEREETVDDYRGSSSVFRETEREMGAERVKMGILQVEVVHGFPVWGFRFACISKGVAKRNIPHQRENRRRVTSGGNVGRAFVTESKLIREISVNLSSLYATVDLRRRKDCKEYEKASRQRSSGARLQFFAARISTGDA
jgi:hypothetical protein